MLLLNWQSTNKTSPTVKLGSLQDSLAKNNKKPYKLRSSKWGKAQMKPLNSSMPRLPMLLAKQDSQLEQKPVTSNKHGNEASTAIFPDTFWPCFAWTSNRMSKSPKDIGTPSTLVPTHSLCNYLTKGWTTENQPQPTGSSCEGKNLKDVHLIMTNREPSSIRTNKPKWGHSLGSSNNHNVNPRQMTQIWMISQHSLRKCRRTSLTWRKG